LLCYCWSISHKIYTWFNYDIELHPCMCFSIVVHVLE
jgi:hypothetical protein